MTRLTAPALLIATLLAAPAFGQTASPTSGEPSEKPASPDVASCKTTALTTISAKEPEIKDIYVDEDGLTIATADTKVEDTPVKRIIMGEAYIRTDRSDKPRRFLCLIGDKGKVLLTFFTAR